MTAFSFVRVVSTFDSLSGSTAREQIFDLDAHACSPVSVCLKYATNPHLRSSTKFSDQARSRDRQVFPTPLA